MAVDVRRKRGIWLDGVHWSHPKGGSVMINLEAVNEWIRPGSKSERASRAAAYA